MRASKCLHAIIFVSAMFLLVSIDTIIIYNLSPLSFFNFFFESNGNKCSVVQLAPNIATFFTATLKYFGPNYFSRKLARIFLFGTWTMLVFLLYISFVMRLYRTSTCSQHEKCFAFPPVAQSVTPELSWVNCCRFLLNILFYQELSKP